MLARHFLTVLSPYTSLAADGRILPVQVWSVHLISQMLRAANANCTPDARRSITAYRRITPISVSVFKDQVRHSVQHIRR